MYTIYFFPMKKNKQFEDSQQGNVFVLTYASKRGNSGKVENDVHINLFPLLLSFDQLVMNRLIETYKNTILSDQISQDSRSNANVSINDESKIMLNLKCNQITVEVPLSSFDIESEAYTNFCSTSYDTLFQRCGYNVEPINYHPYPFVSFTTNKVSVNLLRNDGYPEEQEVEANVKLQTAIVSLTAECTSTSKTHKQFDLLSIDSEQLIDPDAIIKLSYSKVSLQNKTESFKKKRAKHFFPLVVPLGSVKSSQHFHDENTTNDNIQNHHIGTKSFGDSVTHTLKSVKQSVRGSDPQQKMLKAVGACNSNIHVSIPNIAMDFTTNEIAILAELMNLLPSNSEEKEKEDVKDVIKSPLYSGFGGTCNQITLTVHHNFDNLKDSPQDYVVTQLVAVDEFRIHCVMDRSKLKQCRVVSDDLTLHDGE